MASEQVDQHWLHRAYKMKDPDITLEGIKLEALEAAWGLIANARDWLIDDEQSKQWIAAAEKWRDGYWHPILKEELHG